MLSTLLLLALSACGTEDPVLLDTGADAKSIIGITIEVDAVDGLEATAVSDPCPYIGSINQGCWYLDETAGGTAFDSSGYGSSGTYQNGVLLTGICGGFDGSNDYVSVPYATAFDLGTSDLSLAAWVYQTPGYTSGVRVIVDHRASTTSPRGFELFLYNGRPGVQLADSGGYTNFISPTALATGWHHVAVTVDRDQASGLQFYVDGAAWGAAFNPTGRSGSLANTGGLAIGRVAPQSSSHLRGSLCGVSVYSRALPASALAAVFEVGL